MSESTSFDHSDAVPSTAWELASFDRLTDPQLITELGALSEAAASTDGLAPFNEDTLLNLSSRRALIVRDAQQQSLLAAALSSESDTGEVEAELVVHPAARRHGIGTALAQAQVSSLDAGTATLRVWAHGDLPGSREIAARLGATATRELYVLALAVTDAFPQPELPTGMHIRAFDPQRDAERWIDLNARAFATHPEQGRLRLPDLEARMAQPWFNAGDFLVLTEGERLVGYCWCKVDAGEFEIYVLGVDPDSSGQGLGKALMFAGLERMRERGAQQVILYVDGSNTPAMALYRRLGFATHRLDVQYTLHPTTVASETATD